VDWNDSAIAKKLDADLASSNKLGGELNQAYQTTFGTPTLIINGSPYMEQRSVELLSLVVNLIKNKNMAVQQCPATIIETNKDYSATITTNKGDIVIDLLEKSAPIAVNNFVSLAQSGWFSNNAFFVVRDQFAMTGDKTNTGLGGPGYAFKDEVDPKLAFDKEGVVGMYNFGPGTNGSQFFILKTPLTALNGRYTIFGLVTQGLDVLKTLALHETNQSVDSADKILSVTITAK
jgi:cyclophilin family peptidyl-prolyl cis-trans isomerase